MKTLSEVARDLEILAQASDYHKFTDAACAYEHAARLVRSWIEEANKEEEADTQLAEGPMP